MFSSLSWSWTLTFSQSCWTIIDSQFIQARMGQFMHIRTSDVYLQILQLTLGMAVVDTSLTKNSSKNVSIFYEWSILKCISAKSQIYLVMVYSCYHTLLQKPNAVFIGCLVIVNIKGKPVAINLLDNAFNVRVYSEWFHYSNCWIDMAVLTILAGKVEPFHIYLTDHYVIINVQCYI
jgi:hypothetical protein